MLTEKQSQKALTESPQQYQRTDSKRDVISKFLSLLGRKCASRDRFVIRHAGKLHERESHESLSSENSR